MPLLKPDVGNNKIIATSTTKLYVGIFDASDATVTAQSPTVSVRRDSDGFFFNGTVFVDTSGVPTPLAMTEIGAAAPGLYTYSLVDPGLLAPLAKDEYQIRYINSGAPTGELWDVREVEKALRDINTQGV